MIWSGIAPIPHFCYNTESISLTLLLTRLDTKSNYILGNSTLDLYIIIGFFCNIYGYFSFVFPDSPSTLYPALYARKLTYASHSKWLPCLWASSYFVLIGGTNHRLTHKGKWRFARFFYWMPKHFFFNFFIQSSSCNYTFIKQTSQSS